MRWDKTRGCSITVSTPLWLNCLLHQVWPIRDSIHMDIPSSDVLRWCPPLNRIWKHSFEMGLFLSHLISLAHFMTLWWFINNVPANQIEVSSCMGSVMGQSDVCCRSQDNFLLHLLVLLLLMLCDVGSHLWNLWVWVLHLFWVRCPSFSIKFYIF